MMAEQIYYFNARGVLVWANPDNIVDNSLATFGDTDIDGATQLLTGNTCPGADLGTITKVELRLYSKADGDDIIIITPVFSAGDGDPHETPPMLDPGDWTAYIEITNDTNHPDWSLWSHIQTLDCKLTYKEVGRPDLAYCAKVEIRVTYTPAPEAIVKVADESIGLTESSLRGLKSYRFTLETVGIGEAALRLGHSNRISSESLGIADSAAQRKWAIRLFSEAIGIVDELVRRLRSVRVKAEIVNIADSGVHFFRAFTILAKLIRKLIQVEDIGGGKEV